MKKWQQQILVYTLIIVAVFIQHYSSRSVPLDPSSLHTALEQDTAQYPTQSHQDVLKAQVETVFDGDTFAALLSDGTSVHVRLLGINSPEVAGPYRTAECFGKEASSALKNLLPKGTPVQLQTDPTQDTKDKYGRMLAYVFTSDNVLLNEQLIRTGSAYEYTYRKPYQKQSDFQSAEKVAMTQGAGMWAACPARIRN
jgi:micrococcal nuclease